MSKKISTTERQRIRGMLDKHMQQAELAIYSMIALTHESVVGRQRSLKLKQALLSLRVEYNRLRLKYEDD